MGEARARLEELFRAARRRTPLLILTHNNPDPDSLASALGLQFLLRAAQGIEASIAFGGVIARAENRAMIRELAIDLVPFEQVVGRTVRGFALVDTQPGQGNNTLPRNRRASIVVDHHPKEEETGRATFHDVRPHYGSTATIIAEYLRAADLQPDERLAIALFYGIKSDTLDFGRQATTADVEAYAWLFPFVDRQRLARIERPPLPADYFADLRTGLQRARVFAGRAVLCELGRPRNPDMIAEVADLFLRLEGVQWSVATGWVNDGLHLSVRAAASGANANRLIRRLVRGWGTGGGHDTMAGGHVPLRGRSREEIERSIRRRLLHALAFAERSGVPLLGTSSE